MHIPSSYKTQWIVCQIGAREHYAIARALYQAGVLARLYTDAYWKSTLPFQNYVIPRQLLDRQHAAIPQSLVRHFLPRFALQRIRTRSGSSSWDRTIADNKLFEKCVSGRLAKLQVKSNQVTVFAYSYAAEDIFRIARTRGWRTVLGQIDPGPEEERIVKEEHKRFPEFKSLWKPPPKTYWEQWRRETQLADTIIVNSEWSKECLLKECIPERKIAVIPLSYDIAKKSHETKAHTQTPFNQSLRVLFLGQVNLRKGIARLLKAMQLLIDTPEIELQITGPSEVMLDEWLNLPNVNYTQAVPRSEVGKQYLAADLFILPTLSDGFALTQLEAQAYGIPILTSQFCGRVVPSENRSIFILPDLEPTTIKSYLLHILKLKQNNSLPTGALDSPKHTINNLMESLLNIQGGLHD